MAISLNSIIKSARPKAPIVLIHGTPGIGKTTFAAAAPNPIFIQTEEGLGILESNTPHFPLCSSFGEVIESMNALLNEEHEFQWVIFDSLSAMEDLVFASVATDNGKKSIEDLGYGKGYVIALDYWGQFFQGVQALRDKGMGVLMIAHTTVTRFDSPDTESYDRYQIALDKRAQTLLVERCDIIGFAQYKVLTHKEEGKGTRKVTKALSTNERLIHFSEKPAYVAKNRYWLPDTLPFEWSEFYGALTNSINR